MQLDYLFHSTSAHYMSWQRVYQVKSLEPNLRLNSGPLWGRQIGESSAIGDEFAGLRRF
jgi:hypothetical protein